MIFQPKQRVRVVTNETSSGLSYRQFNGICIMPVNTEKEDVVDVLNLDTGDIQAVYATSVTLNERV